MEPTISFSFSLYIYIYGYGSYGVYGLSIFLTSNTNQNS